MDTKRWSEVEEKREGSTKHSIKVYSILLNSIAEESKAKRA
jgi:hypothetical protein